MKHKVAELEGALLDAAVAKAEGAIEDGFSPGNWYFPRMRFSCNKKDWCPSGSWEHGGPIIERECIAIYESFGVWVAGYGLHAENGHDWGGETGIESATIEFDGATGYGETPLVAAMRAFVVGKFGDEIEL